MPVFTFMVFATIEYGFVSLAYGAMHRAAGITARDVGVNTLTAPQVEAAVKARMPAWIANASTVTAVTTSDVNPLKNSVKITVTAPVQTATPLPMFTFAPSWVLSASVTVRQELRYDDGVKGSGGGDD